MSKMENCNSLAKAVLELSQTRLLSSLRFLSGAITAVRPEPGELACAHAFWLDGDRLLYHPVDVLHLFQKERENVPAALLHVLGHLLMGHPFRCQNRERVLWDTACDLAAEYVRLELCDLLRGPAKDGERRKRLDAVCDAAGGTAAEHFYNYLVESALSADAVRELSDLFAWDDHGMWYRSQEAERTGSGHMDPNSASREDENEDEDTVDGIRKSSDDKSLERRSYEEAQSSKKWKQIARQVQTEVEVFYRKRGTHAGCMREAMKAFLFEEVDYSQFLRIFANENEVLSVSDEEFDVIYYTYGLSRYGNMPLVEPLEYSSRTRIRAFVIAVDTSGSVQGDLVQDFLRRTFQILRETESFEKQVEVYVIQCDSEIQDCVRIRSLDEIDRLVQEMEISGYGGTDFRPVFRYVEELREKNAWKKIDGLLYFTDGVGTYPEQAPDYKTAFIFQRDDYETPQVPSWAMRAVLTSDSIKLVNKWSGNDEYSRSKRADY